MLKLNWQRKKMGLSRPKESQKKVGCLSLASKEALFVMKINYKKSVIQTLSTFIPPIDLNIQSINAL